MEKVLEVKNLKISFRTNNGNVKAVRDVSFDLYKGETLGIVGESGSGKSVTARAMLGILAGNKIIEGGELFYEGQDLLRLSESDFYNIRGTKISMIFQDPLSSLNPIMKIGKQITEAMILKSKTARRVGKENIKLFNNSLLENAKNFSNEQLLEFKNLIKQYQEVVVNYTIKEIDYDHAHANFERANKVLSETIEILKNQGSTIENIASNIDQFIEKIKQSINGHIITHDNVVFKKIPEITRILKVASKQDDCNVADVKSNLNEILTLLDKELKEILRNKKPDFIQLAVSEHANINFNEITNKYLGYVKMAVQNSYNKSLENKKQFSNYLKEKQAIITDSLTEAQARKFTNHLTKMVNEAANLLSPGQDKYFYVLISQLVARFEDYYLLRKSELAALKKASKPINEANLNESLEVLAKVQEFYGKIIDAVNENITAEPNFNDYTKKLIANYKDFVKDFVDYVNIFEAKQNALDLMREVGIPQPEKRYNQYPFQFSGGMRQRIVIAIAISFNPDVLICDEPTTALDVTIQAQILELINKIKQEHNLSVIFITHDLGVIANMADRIAVMYAGRIIEYGQVEELFYDPKHPYTWALLSSIPDLDTKEKLESIPGTPPNMIHPPKGDAFAPRNKYAMKIDLEENPPMFKVTDTHYAATWLLHPKAPKVSKPKIVTERIERMKQQLGVKTNGKK